MEKFNQNICTLIYASFFHRLSVMFASLKLILLLSKWQNLLHKYKKNNFDQFPLLKCFAPSEPILQFSE